MAFIRIVFVFFCCFFATVEADQVNLEYKVKAAYLYNFTKFISWPENQQDSFNICIVGTDPFGQLLKPIEQRSVQGKPIRLYYFQSIKPLKSCQIIYVDTLKELRFLKKNSLLRGKLTVSSQPSFAEHGGMIGFVIKDERVRLQINLAALQHDDLKINAKLLEIADLVVGDGNE